jgi:hypothetical protein
MSFAPPVHADGWSLGAGTGPFIFGKFAERTQGIRNEENTAVLHSTLSAATRPGASADLNLDLARRVSLRADVTWTRAPLRLESRGGSGVTLTAGDVHVTSLAVPLVFHLITGGAFELSLLGGPAAAHYQLHRSAQAPTSLPLFTSGRTRLGGMAGASLAWWLSRRFAIEGQLTDTVTASPFRRENIASSSGLTAASVSIPKTENVHTTVGIRYRFR